MKDKLERVLQPLSGGQSPPGKLRREDWTTEALEAVARKTRFSLQQKIQSHGKTEVAADLIQTLRVLARSHRRFTEEQKTKVFRSIIKEARLKADGVELEMYVQPTRNVWWKYRQTKARDSSRSSNEAQTIRIRTRQALVRS